MIDRAQVAAARLLLREIGVVAAVRAVSSIALARLRGEPFKALEPASCQQERLSREQAGPAILLYRALRAVLADDARALEVTRRAVVAGAHVFLAQTLGPLRQRELAALDDAERRRFVEARGERFFNATIDWTTVTPREVSFVVRACRFPRLCQWAGVPELAPLFCAGDASFFGGVEPDVVLERPHTIAEGADCCPFTLRWR